MREGRLFMDSVVGGVAVAGKALRGLRIRCHLPKHVSQTYHEDPPFEAATCALLPF